MVTPDKLRRALAKAEKALGLEIRVRMDGSSACLEANDDELRGRRFAAVLHPPSRFVDQAKAFHEEIYHARCQEKYRQQSGLCAHCKRPLRGRGETDHIKTRARGGRDDRLSNLQVVCHSLSGGCTFHQDKHSKGKTT